MATQFHLQQQKAIVPQSPPTKGGASSPSPGTATPRNAPSGPASSNLKSGERLPLKRDSNEASLKPLVDAVPSVSSPNIVFHPQRVAPLPVKKEFRAPTMNVRDRTISSPVHHHVPRRAPSPLLSPLPYLGVPLPNMTPADIQPSSLSVTQNPLLTTQFLRSLDRLN